MPRPVSAKSSSTGSSACFFEGLLDDSINISVCPYWIKKIIAPGVYAMNGTPVIGDHLTAYTPSKSEMIEGFVVKSVKP